MIGLAGLSIPNQSCLTLVGNSDRGDVPIGGAGLLQRDFDDLLSVSPDLHRIMLDPARLRINLFMLELVNRY